MGSRFDAVLAAVHDRSEPPQSWLSQVALAVGRCLPVASGSAAYSYDFAKPTPLERVGCLFADVAPDLHERTISELAMHTPPDVGALWHRPEVALASRLPVGANHRSLAEETSEHLRRLGWADCIGLNAGLREDAGVHISIALGAPLTLPSRSSSSAASCGPGSGSVGSRSGVRRLPPRTMAALCRVSRHLALAYRQRLFASLAEQPADAVVVSGGGAVLSGAELADGLDPTVLKLAARYLNGPARLRRSDSETELARVWDTFVAGGFEILAAHDTDGRRYLVLRRPTRAVLMARHQREIAARSLIGMTPKEICSEMGLAPSTVALHRRRALAQLGGRSRPRSSRSEGGDV